MRIYRRRYGYPRRWAIAAQFFWGVEHLPLSYEDQIFARLARWGYRHRKAAERAGTRERLRREIKAQLCTVYKPEGVRIWLSGRHKLLSGERPNDLIDNGQGERVLTIATQLAESAYA